MKTRKKIFWFEDDAYSMEEHYKELKEKYDVLIGAHKELIEQKRKENHFDLVLVDLMIHKYSIDSETQKELTNISFTGIHWTKIGVEFLKKLREGEYEFYGFRKDIPIIAATASVDSATRKTVESDIGVEDFLVKPFPIDRLGVSIERVLNPSNKKERQS